ncbi:efflux RND transporter periplasmic adaptor subunit [Rahnella sp. AA]|uniref:efflux RND transporter periplasmic adaptor subunit n=1 Tax=Rahnella sp. AA TaxID=2057180 RepID=UPI000C33F651|nr:efflux RND transporter periplasmic adaptor subunit [Rahnella sp. AA]PKE29474.1 efflux RND transporter periplasmic adaptor subunit [Rahnella sp. AA]
MTISKPKRLAVITFVLVCGASFWGYSLRTSPAAEKPAAAAPLVSLVAAQSKDLPLTLNTQGHLVSLNQVDVRGQVTSAVAQVAFHEGDFVKKGQLLFVLDDAEQQAALHHAVAQLAVMKAQRDKATSDLNRGKSLVKQNYISSSDWDTLVSAQQQYAAQYLSAQDDIRTAQAQLAYTRIYAPVSGKTGALNVHPGSLAQPSSTLPLVSINQFDPIGAEFTLPEQNLNSVIVAQQHEPVKVWVNDANGKRIAGTLNFIDNSVSTTSGTVSFKATFDNANNLLWPGLYQNITVDAGTTPNAVVLPPQAVQDGPDGHFVYVIDKQSHAATVPVTLLRIQQQMAVVEGLSAGMQVVSEGARMLRPGMAVTVAANHAGQTL